MKKTIYYLSLSYWFSSRTLGLLVHPYVTMRIIVREHFLRPLVFVPILFWFLSFVLGIVLTRIGMFFHLGSIAYAYHISMFFILVWLIGTIFVGVWQSVLLYLYFRFLHVQ